MHKSLVSLCHFYASIRQRLLWIPMTVAVVTMRPTNNHVLSNFSVLDVTMNV